MIREFHQDRYFIMQRGNGIQHLYINKKRVVHTSI